ETAEPEVEETAELEVQETAEPEVEETAEPEAEETAELEVQEAIVSLEQHQRLLAEFDNYRKRMERDRERHTLWARAELLKALLPCLDDFERAWASHKENQKDVASKGILIIMNRLAETLKQEGLNEVEASPGEVFDPEIHQAVLTVPSTEIRAGCVTQILEKGYCLGDLLLRPAKVGVARVQDTEATPQEE
ncbi:MAG: nucleotide exchange factor GrpE, partial [Candidatus Eisenbacteria sp.]|nr:nucleotide exchange factor GrpE [Candidatus Eisenbacteria bacterium]